LYPIEEFDYARCYALKWNDLIRKAIVNDLARHAINDACFAGLGQNMPPDGSEFSTSCQTITSHAGQYQTQRVAARYLRSSIQQIVDAWFAYP
jgi:hypothetical protein